MLEVEVAAPLAAAGASPIVDMAPPQQRTSIELSRGPSFSQGQRSAPMLRAELFLDSLRERGAVPVDEVLEESVLAHFAALPPRYALDVNIDGLDVLSHIRLLQEARADPSAVSFAARPVEVQAPAPDDAQGGPGSAHHHAGSGLALPTFPAEPSPRGGGQAVPSAPRRPPLPRPAFGSSPNLQALALEASDRPDSFLDGGGDSGRPLTAHATFYEITVAAIDQPKLLSRLSDAMGDLGLNIREAHVFNTKDGFALDVFVVDGWADDAACLGDPDEGLGAASGGAAAAAAGGGQSFSGQSLELRLGQRLLCMPPPGPPAGRAGSGPLAAAPPPPLPAAAQAPLAAAPPAPVHHEDWEIDVSQLQIESKIAAGSFGDLYRGSYCGQEVAVKVLRDPGEGAYDEFLQEVAIMRKVRHRNVVQFIGACTRPPSLCIVFEYMAHGSVFDWCRREGRLAPAQALRVAAEVARGMDYLHRMKIVHRDLKAANLLLDDTGAVKIADFGVARAVEERGHMTAETGTYRWMAPEVIEHRPYDERADVFSFGILLWELVTGKIPYSDITPLQAAVGVVQRGLRPPIPPHCPPRLAAVMAACWAAAPDARPAFKDLAPLLQRLLEETRAAEADSAAAAGGRAGGAAAPRQGLLSRLNLRGPPPVGPRA